MHPSTPLVLPLSGRIDSSNAAAVEAELTNRLTGHDGAVALDADALDYISSAGLRVILRLRKQFPSLEIINVSADVYDIFEMTGFSEIIPITRAYRKLSVEGCEVVGQGANGKVYRLDADTIIKVYLNPDSLPDIQRERELARRAFVLGVPTAIPYDVVRVGDGYGSVFELLNSRSLAKLVAAEPDRIGEYAKLSVDLLKLIHSTEVAPEDMPDIRQTVLDWADFLRDYLPAGKYEKLRSLIAVVPERHTMIHGDYHVKNVMMQNGEALLIDMDTLSQGHPVFEFASIYNAYLGFSALDPAVSGQFLGIDHDLSVRFWNETLRLYFGTTDSGFLSSIEDKAALLGYTRLMRRLIRRGGLENDDSRSVVDFYKQQIETLLDRVDTLNF